MCKKHNERKSGRGRNGRKVTRESRRETQSELKKHRQRFPPSRCSLATVSLHKRDVHEQACAKPAGKHCSSISEREG